MARKVFAFVVVGIIVSLWGSFPFASVPQIINYQGKLTSASGGCLSDTVQMIFSIYPDSSSSTASWSETLTQVTVKEGVFSVLLGSVKPIPDSIFNGSIRYLGLKVESDPEMTPRKPMVSVGYAYKSLEADTADYARAFSGTVDNADKVDGLHASATPTAGYLYPLDGSAKIPNARLYTGSGNGLDADLLDGQHASAFLSTANDYGRSGVASDLYEGTTTLTDKYVNEGQASSVTSGMITDNQIVDADVSPTANIVPSKISGTAWTSNNDGSGSGLDADLLDGQHASSFLSGSGAINYIPKFTGAATLGNSAIYQNASNVGIGTTSPATTLHVQGDELIKSTGGSVSLSGSDGALEVWGTDGAFIDLKDSEGDDYDFRITQIGGTGNLGLLGGGVGIGTTSPQNKLDVEGSAVVGATYSGTTAAPFNGFLVEGKVGIGTTSPQNKLDVEGSAVIGATYSGTTAAPTNGFLVEGNVGIGTTDPSNAKLNVSATGTDLAVYGHTTGSNYAGYFENNSSSSANVLEVETNGSGAAVRGYSSGTGNAGRFQIVNASSAGNALYASTNGTGKAGYFSGDVQITGNLSKGSGSFRIDHPLDPENKYLNHSFVESPDMKNVYDGVAVLDAKGEARIELPNYFETLNKDFRYQLTAMGAPGPNLYVAGEISGNNFEIAGGQPGMKVSWQITGIRKDPYAQKHRIPVEEEKLVSEKGKYLHPDAYGLGEQYGIHYEEQKRMEEEHKRMEQERP